MVRKGFRVEMGDLRKMPKDADEDKAVASAPTMAGVHEEFVQHLEGGQRRIRVLSLLTLVVAVLLSASYFSQIVYPYVSGESVVSVNLRDPSLIASEVLVLLLAFAWIYVGATDYLFATRLGRLVKAARKAEKEMAAEAGLAST